MTNHQTETLSHILFCLLGVTKMPDRELQNYITTVFKIRANKVEEELKQFSISANSVS
jgi:hypothetical protein